MTQDPVTTKAFMRGIHHRAQSRRIVHPTARNKSVHIPENPQLSSLVKHSRRVLGSDAVAVARSGGRVWFSKMHLVTADQSSYEQWAVSRCRWDGLGGRSHGLVGRAE